MKKLLAILLFTTSAHAQIINGGSGGGGFTPTVNRSIPYASGGALTNSNQLIWDTGGLLNSLGFAANGNTGGVISNFNGAQNNSIVNPDATGNDNQRTGLLDYIMFPGGQPANYSNNYGRRMQVDYWNGRNSSDNNDKRTPTGLMIDSNFDGAGQTFGVISNVTKSSTGDAVAFDADVKCEGYVSAGGDEGCIGGSYRINHNGTAIATTITSSTAATGSTTLSAGVSKSTSTTDIKSVAVGSTTGFAVGDWVTIDQTVVGVGQQVPEETLQLTTCSAGHICGIFEQDHSMGATVKPASRIVLANMVTGNGYTYRLGQGRLLVNNDLAYNSGTVSTIVDNMDGTWTVTGSSTGWATNTVGGNTNLAGCFSATIDDYVSRDGFPASAWYPIKSVTDATHLVILKYTGASSGWSNYRFAPCAYIDKFELSSTSTSLTPAAVILGWNSFTWTNGDEVVQAASPWSNMQHGSLVLYESMGPTADNGFLYRAANGMDSGSTSKIPTAAFRADADGMKDASLAGFLYGIDINAWTQYAGMSITGKNLAGIGLTFATFSGDNKQITWNTSGGGSTIEADYTTNVLKLRATNAAIGFVAPSYVFYENSPLLATVGAYPTSAAAGVAMAGNWGSNERGLAKTGNGVDFAPFVYYDGSTGDTVLRDVFGATISFRIADNSVIGSIDDSGNATFIGLKTTGAATGKKVVCVDTSTGKLYASSTGTDCSN